MICLNSAGSLLRSEVCCVTFSRVSLLPPPPEGGGGGRGRGPALESLEPTGRHGAPHLEVPRRDLDHLIAGCVTTAAKFPPFQPTQPVRPLSGWTGSDGHFHSIHRWIGGCRGDALAGMPLVKPRAQLAFKDSMIRGILQFTLRIAFRCVLHRCKSQDIRC